MTAAPPRDASHRADGAASPLLAAERLSLRYDGASVLREVTLPIAGGRITAIVGPSGCGKTSFLCCINRLTDLIPGSHVEGSLRFGGDDILDRAADVVALRRRIGMIFQKPNPFPMSIRRNLDLPLREHGVRDRATRDAAIETSLRDVGLWDDVRERLGASALTLSGGQQQRLCIARALVLRPEVILLDEPCSALDPMASGVVEDLIVELRRRYTIVIVTHNLAQARRIADDVAVFWLREGVGRLIEHGPSAAVFEQPADDITRAYLRGDRG